MKNKFYQGFTVKQAVWYVLGLIFAIAGLLFIIANTVNGFLNVAPRNNWIIDVDNWIKSFTNTNFGLLIFGIAFLVLGALIISIVLTLAESNEDKLRDRENRKQARLKQMMEDSVAPEQEVVEIKKEA